MRFLNKKTLIILSTSITIVFIVVFIINIIVEQKIANAFKTLPKNININYKKIGTNVLRGDLVITSPKIMITDIITDSVIADVALKSLKIENLGYWDYFVNNKISIENIIIENSFFKHVYNPNITSKNEEKQFLNKLKRVIEVENIDIIDAAFLITDFETDLIKLKLLDSNSSLNDFRFNPKSLENK